MPIYAYKCHSCGFAKDVLQKLSDAPLTECPSCGQASFTKQLTAAGFQLKGTGWYATDFKGGAKPASESGTGAAEPAKPDAAAPAVAAKESPATPAAPATTASSTTGGCASGCGCHA